MKKLLGIVVLGLLFFASSLKAEMINGIEVFHKDENSITTSQKGWTFNKQYTVAAQHCAKYKKFAYNNSNYLQKEKPKKIIFTCSNPQQQLTHINGKKIQWTNYKHNYQWESISSTSSSSVSSSTSTNDKIAQSKQICKDLGFKTNTEKFADCALKMMSMDFEATNKVSSGSGTTQQIIVQQPSYDIWDALLDVSFMLQNNNSSSSSGSSGSRCVVNRTNSMTGQTVMNCY